MKVRYIPFILFLGSVFVSCLGGKENAGENNKIHTVDVSKTYPKKKLVLQDIADIRYIPIETSDEFLCASGPRVIAPDKIIIPEYKSGDILVYDAEGKALNKFNRKGGGPEEYAAPTNLMYDENTGELFIKSTPSQM